MVVQDGRWIGYNTDGTGALRSLRAAGLEPKGSEVFCYGAGGTARSLCFTLASAGAGPITISSRSELCEQLAGEINRHFPGSCSAVRAEGKKNVNAAASGRI